MRTLSAALRHALAAEYVLGTLRGRARSRFEALVRADRELEAVVREWENFMLPLADGAPGIEPPERVWQAIEARLGPRAAPAASSPWTSLALWRFAGAGLAAAVVALAIVVAGQRPAPALPRTMLVAVLSAADQEARILVERHDGALKVRMMRPWPSLAGQDLELWVVPRDGPPRSLGVVPYDRDSEIRRADIDAKLLDGVSLAVSREPAGGSPTGQPTGKVICTGTIARARKT